MTSPKPRAPRATPSKSKATTVKVGDTYELKGHCMVEYPDGTVVTASRQLVVNQPGKYKVTYNAKPKGSAATETFIVTKGASTRARKLP